MVAEGSDPLARVIVGRRGAGKTRCLVELRNGQIAGGCDDVLEPEYDLPSLSHVTRLAEEMEYRPELRSETWEKLWERAIVQSTLSVVDSSPDREPRSIYREFGRILATYPTLERLREYLSSADWDATRAEFERALKARSEPLCFFLDSLEEDSAHAPLYWIWCQKGLVTQILRFALDAALADKLRIHAAVREQTWLEVRRLSPARMDFNPYVRALRWDAETTADFLSRKVRHLNTDYMLGEISGAKTTEEIVAAWLGTTHVHNSVRDCDEPIARYILRHTRLIPRDVITVGNLLARETLGAARRGERRLADQRIQRAVAEAGRLAAAEELQSCGVEIVARRLASGRTPDDRRQIASGEDAVTGATERLGTLLRECGHDVFPAEKLRALEGRAYEAFNADVHITDMLWRHGLIGHGNDPDAEFEFAFGAGFSIGERSTEKRWVAMHPILIDAIGVATAGPSPVVPFDPSDIS